MRRNEGAGPAPGVIRIRSVRFDGPFEIVLAGIQGPVHRKEIASGIVTNRDVDADGAQHRLDQHLRFGVLLMAGRCVDAQMHRERAFVESAVGVRPPSGRREQTLCVGWIVAVRR